MKTVKGIIPARYESSRFPGKPLAKINGKTLILHVCEKVEKAIGKENTFVATDNETIFEHVENNGYNSVMTSESAMTGTDRVWEASQKLKADIYLNIQGDEPMVSPDDIVKVKNFKEDNINSVVCGMTKIAKNESPSDINLPKVLCNSHNTLIYMSRLPIPGCKDANKGTMPVYMKQVCIYGFSKSELDAFISIKEKPVFEKHEDIEILRFFDLGIQTKMIEVTGGSLAVDNPEDVKRVENALKEK